jgi:serine/threonine-protein kinase
VHRDLKPANLFLTQRKDGSALVKVLDFGISKAVGMEGSQPSMTATTAGDGLDRPLVSLDHGDSVQKGVVT